MQLLVAILYYTAPPEEAALRRLVRKVRAATPAAIYVFHHPRFDVPPVPGATVRAVWPGNEKSSALPAGWLAAASVLADHAPPSDVLLLDGDNGNLLAASIAKAARAMRDEAPDALVSVVASRDHPCQWEDYFDVRASQAFIPIEAGPRRVAGKMAAMLGTARRPVVSRPFVMPASGPRLDCLERSRLYEWFPAEGVLAAVASPSEAQPAAPRLEGRVFLWRESRCLFRQAAFDEEPLAALPLLTPARGAHARIVREGEGWEIRFAPDLADPMRYQVYPLPAEGCAYDTSGSLRWSLVPPATGSEEGARAAMEPIVAAPLFLLNILTPSILPDVDIALPFLSQNGGWDVDPFTLGRKNSLTDSPISGRQCFPEVLELEGSLLGFSAEALRNPLQAIESGNNVVPLELSEKEAKATLSPSCGPEANVVARPGGGRAAPQAAGPGRGDLVADRLIRLESLIDRADCVPDPQGGAGGALGKLGDILGELVKARQAHAAMCLQKDTVMQHVFDNGKTGDALLPLRIHNLFHSKGLRRFSANVEDAFFYPLMDKLLGLWENKLGVTTAEALASMRGQAERLGLAPCWRAGLPLALARKGLLREAWDMLQADYRETPWLCDDHARIAFECLRPTFRFEEYLAWIEKDAAPGRMSNSWVYFYGEALGVNRKLKRAVEVVDRAYSTYQNLENCHAAAYWWRYMTRDFFPARALMGFERDKAAGRSTDDFAILHAAALAATGRFAQAVVAVESAYSANPAVANGFAWVGWYYYFLRKRNPDKAIAMFERDIAQNRLQTVLRSYLACLFAFKRDMRTAEEIVERIYAESPFYIGYFAQLGLMHWLRQKDLAVVLKYFEMDQELGRLERSDFKLCYAAFLSLAGKSGLASTGALLASAMPSLMAWDLCGAWLKSLGFRAGDVAGLMTPALREVFVAGAPSSLNL